MASSPGSGASNPRKFSEKIALHTQKQAEETRAFEQLMTDLTVSRVQFQKIQQLHLSQSRATCYGGSLPNVNQISNTSGEFQGGFPPGVDPIRGTRHHGLVERPHRDRNRINSPHRRPTDKHGRQMESSPYGGMYLSPPLDNSWRRTNSDSALHTSAMIPNPQDPFGGNQTMSRAPPQRNASVNDAEVDGAGNIFSFPPLSNDESLMGVCKPLPKQLWEAKKVQSLASRPKSCEVPGINIFPSPDQNPALSHFQGLMNSGGSLPDLTNLHFPSPLSTPLDPDDHTAFPNLSGGSSTGNLPAAMMHLGISSSQGLSSSLSNPSLQLSLNASQLQSSLSNPSISSSLRLSNNSPRRRPTPISPLTLSPSNDQRKGLSSQLSPTSPPLSSITQGVTLDTSNMPREPPPPYPLYASSQHAVDQGRQRQQHQQQQLQQQPASPLRSPSLDLSPGQNMSALYSDPFIDPQFSSRIKTLPYQCDQFGLMENSLASTSSTFDPSSSSLLFYSQPAMSELGRSHGGLHDSSNTRSNTLYPTCRGGLPNIVLTDDSNPSLSKDVSTAFSAGPECFHSDEGFPLEDELHIEPLSLDGLSMLSDPNMVLPDPSVEDSFRNERL
ncbi:CREB-regulated transcription coactivator 3 isoform X2 [Cheilinus undulatus]|uniref:CREB-regulated transcription coactivator 3 isoform X2 n=1 Tax=Cheilinus undulatus TaxID=241271 RepID=UPI001BD606DE|nr:CREB-regulated transcription coactivator 3 isoform X2 [Cheilinus undulatus]